MADPPDNPIGAIDLLRGRGERGKELVEELSKLGSEITTAPSWPHLLAVLQWEQAIEAGHIGAINKARRTVQEVRLPDSESLGRSTERHALEGAARWLRIDPLLAADQALALLGQERPVVDEIRLAAATVVALACVQLRLELSAQRYATMAAQLGIQMLNQEQERTQRALISYRTATAVDLLLRASQNQSDETIRKAAWLIEQARRVGVSPRPGNQEIRSILDSSGTTSDLADTDQRITAAVDEPDADLAEAAGLITGHPGQAWWWGLRISEGAAWVASVAPDRGASLVHRPVGELLYVLEDLEQQLPFALDSGESTAFVLRRYRNQRLGLDGRIGVGLQDLIPRPLARAAQGHRGPAIPVAVSIPSAIQYLPPIALPLGRSRRLMEAICPVFVAGRRRRPPSQRSSHAAPNQVVLQGNDFGLAGQVMADISGRSVSFIPSCELSGNKSRLEALLSADDLDVAIITGHMFTQHGEPLHRVESVSAVDQYYVDFGHGATLSNADIDNLPRVPWCVILAACRSGGAMAAMSDERAGMATRFLENGARWVIAALWPIPSSYPQLLTKLINNLSADVEPPEALRLAQLELIPPSQDPLPKGQNDVPFSLAWLPWVCLAANPESDLKQSKDT